jgi:hypothetical protein
MPPSKFRKPEFTLSSADARSMLVKMRCYRCRIEHKYRPDDIVQLAGDLALHDITSHFRCERCKSRDFLRADWHHIYGPDVGRTTIRRLVRVRFVRIPEWRDETI